jgi:hypothetical protein
VKTGMKVAIIFSEIEFAIRIVYCITINLIYGKERARNSVRPLLYFEKEILNKRIKINTLLP